MTRLSLPPAPPFRSLGELYPEDGSDEHWIAAAAEANGREVRVSYAIPLRGRPEWIARTFRMSMC